MISSKRIRNRVRQSDIERVLGASKMQVRHWVRSLEPLRSKPTRQGQASRFTFPEALFLTVVSMLNDCGVFSHDLAPISERLFKVICRPQPVGEEDVLVLWRAQSGWKFEGKPDPRRVQVRVPVFEARALLAREEKPEVLTVQQVIPLGVQAVAGVRRRSA